MHRLEGSIESIVFRNEDNHYMLLCFRPDENRLFRDDLTTIVGILPGIHVKANCLTIEGEWENDSHAMAASFM